MNDPFPWAIRYLAARGDAPWRWVDDGNVIAWADGATIAFRDEIAGVLELLAPRGWPDFGALVWVLAACRGKLPPPVGQESAAPRAGAGKASSFPVDSQSDGGTQLMLGDFHERLLRMHAEVERGLAAISQLPAELRTSLRDKSILAEVIFAEDPEEREPLQKGDPEPGFLAEVIKVIRSGILTDTLLNDPSVPPLEGQREWITLHQGLSRVSPESLRLRRRAGLDALPKAASVPAIPAARLREVLSDLRDDPEHAGLARLARDLMAALQLPRRLSEQDDMPLGGFADIATRGNLDRLLLSELAHDDLTLAVRIALSEALYLRREPPAKHPPSTLAILLDSGIRLWGAPRVLAVAVALGLIGKSAQHERLTAYRASGSGIIPVDLLNKSGIIEQLGALETDPHPGPALAPFRAKLRAVERAEAVLITQRDVFTDHEFRRSLALTEFDALYLAVVDRDGSVELLRYPMGGTPICQVRVNLDELLNPPATPGSLTIDRSSDPDLPLILSMQPFPLLIAVRGRVMRIAGTATGAGACVMRNRQLMKWQSPSRGAEIISTALPSGETLFLRLEADQRITVVKATGGRLRLSCGVFSANGARTHEHDWILRDPVRRVESCGEALLVIATRTATAYDLESGVKLGSLEIAGAGLHSGRYFRVGGRWSVLHWDGQVLHMSPVTLPAAVKNEDIAIIFDREGCEGPCALTSAGNLYSPEGQCILSVGVVRLAHPHPRDPRRSLVLYRDDGKREVLDLPTLGRWTEKFPVYRRDWEWKPPSPGRNLRVHFSQIAISGSGAIYLNARKKGWWQIFLAGGDRLILAKLPPEWRNVGEILDFVPVVTRRTKGFTLRAARWADRRCAWLDDRGMLHLRSANQTKPEVTIVLCEGHCAAWSSDGHWHGPSFFAGDHTLSSAAKIWDRISAFSLAPPPPHS